ncbi:Fic family protein [Candidatus Pacearchaeota archaeon CG06_land_8_20_14_3_00_35_12]|nr:MAG: Fic family protein [Candidatus Pacearchaeota archaeon CG06_land_8_20_14_3_00_35_12]
MYLEKRKTKNGIKYYLAHSFREGGKVQKIRVYLGTNIKKKILEQRQEKAKELLEQQVNSFKIIRSPIQYKFSKRELALIKSLKRKAKFKIFHLSEEDWQAFTELFTYNTNAIEGSTITQNEIFEILKENKWPFNKPKGEISEAYGVAKAISYIRKSKIHLSLKLIQDIHRTIFENSKNFAGKFREKGVEVGIRDGIGNLIHLGAPASRVIPLLIELIKWYNKNKNKLPPIVLAIVIHNQFEFIHPFEDGNGRVGRLLLNNILLKHRLPPVNISMKNRKRYYATLKEFDRTGNIKPSIELILKEYKSLRKELKK